MVRRTLLLLGTIASAAVSAYAVALGLAPTLRVAVPGSAAWGIAHLIAFPIMPLGVGLVGLLLSLLVLGLSRRLRWTRVCAAVVAGVLLLQVLAWSGLRVRSGVHDSGTHWTVLSWNTEGSLTAADARAVMSDHHPDVLVLPETFREQAETAFGPAVLADYRLWVSGTEGDTPPTVLMVRRSLGDYRQVPVDQVSFGAIRVVAPNLPDILAVHPAPPIPELMDRWRAELRTAVGESGCYDPAPHARISAGDYNATLHHGPLTAARHCTDAQEAVGDRWEHTWPTDKPAALGATIDHILTTGSVVPERAVVQRYGTSDHRAVIATLWVGP